jgi:hypothetical protein
MSKIEDLHRKWMKDTRYRKAHQELVSEFELARAVIQARTNAGLTQEGLAKRGYRTARKWSHQTIHADVGAPGGCNWNPGQDHVRARP